MKRRLIVFARAPLPDRVKTRLARSIGATAAGVYARLVCTVLTRLAEADVQGIKLELHVADAEDLQFSPGPFRCSA